MPPKPSIYPSMRLLRWFGDRTTLQQEFTLGIVRDTVREQIPQGGVYDMKDFMADRLGLLYKRGGTTFQSSALPHDLIVGVATPEFPGDPRVLAWGSTGSTRTLYDVTTGTHGTGINLNSTQPIENPPLYNDRLILCDGTGLLGVYQPVKKAYLSAGVVTVTNLTGSPPNTRYSCVHLGFLVLANGSDDGGTTYHRNRLWFAPTGTNTDIEATWDNAHNFIDVPEAITGLASVNGVLLVFTRGFTWRILHSFPPGSVDTNGTPNENMELQPLGAVGCIDARSIVTKDGLVYWANESGVYRSNGAGFDSITSPTTPASRTGMGIQKMWADALAGFSPVLGSVVCAGAWLNDNLFFTIRHASDDPQSGARYQFLWHGQTGAWTTLSDACTADMYATRFAPQGEIYAACGDTSDPVRLLKLSGLFSPSASNAYDANGEAILPYVESRPFYGSPGQKAYGFGHLGYKFDLHDDPSAVLSIQTERGLVASGNEVRRLALESHEPTRLRFDCCFDSQAVTVKVVQTGVSEHTEIHSVEVEVRPYDVNTELE